MVIRHEANPDEGTHGVPERGTGWRKITEWVLGIAGAIAVFLGLFIMFAGEDQHLGLGGDLSWRVGDISTEWANGLLIGGGVLLVIVLFLVLQGRSRSRS